VTRQAPPTDDLYARLAVSPTASTAEIEASWRELMKLHHPDVAGPLSTALAQRINVARDWLVDRERRARYDASLAGRRARHVTSSPSRSRPSRQANGRPRRPAAVARPVPRFDPWTADFGPRTMDVRGHLRALAALSPDALARLANGPSAPLVDAIPGFVPEERREQLNRIEAALAAVLPADIRRHPALVSAVLGQAFALALGDLVGRDELVAHLLSDPWHRAVSGVPA
jgi:curved DNA-binding protein CbpA